MTPWMATPAQPMAAPGQRPRSRPGTRRARRPRRIAGPASVHGRTERRTAEIPPPRLLVSFHRGPDEGAQLAYRVDAVLLAGVAGGEHGHQVVPAPPGDPAHAVDLQSVLELS